MESPGTISRNGQAPPDLDRLDEALWVIEARAGCVEAFGLLMKRYERRMLYYLGRLITQREAALDAHQELWLEAFRGIHHLEQPKAFRAWLYRIAHRKAARFIQREIRDAAAVEILETPPEALTASVTDEALDVDAVHRALDRLPALQREALTLHYLRDLSLEEMASALECPIGTVKSRLHHGRIAMRSLLEKEKLL
jgi:RNA polymerase sigma-70 factor, ECF subfamily